MTPQQQLIAQIRAHLERDVATLEAAVAAAAEAATHEESQPENEYDTRGLEASYLAGAQAARLGELRQALAAVSALRPLTFGENSAVGPTAIVELESEGETMLCFLTRFGAGYPLTLDGKPVIAVTPASPLGAALNGRRVGDYVTVGRLDAETDYEIVGFR